MPESDYPLTGAVSNSYLRQPQIVSAAVAVTVFGMNAVRTISTGNGRIYGKQKNNTVVRRAFVSF